MKTRNRTCGIYSMTHIPSGKRYIGSSIDCESRMISHFKTASDGNGHHFHSEIRRLGKEDFKCEIVEKCSPSSRFKREEYYIKFYKTIYPNGFNLISDPSKYLKYKWTPEMREAARKRMLGRKLSKEEREKLRIRNIGNKYGLGSKRSKEYREASRIRMLGNDFGKNRKFSPEYRKKISERMMGNKNAAGNKNALGLIHTPEAREKIGRHFRGKSLSRGHVAKIQASYRKAIERRNLEKLKSRMMDFEE